MVGREHSFVPLAGALLGVTRSDGRGLGRQCPGQHVTQSGMMTCSSSSTGLGRDAQGVRSVLVLRKKGNENLS